MFKAINRLNIKLLIFANIIMFLLFVKSYSSQIKVGASFAPPYYSVEDKNVSGILAEFMNEILSESDFDFVWKPNPTKRIYSDLINGKIDVYLGPLQPIFDGFNESTIHSSFSPFAIELRAYYYGNRPILTSTRELNGKRITIIRGYTYGGSVNYVMNPENNINYIEVDSFNQAVQILKRRGYDYHLDYKKTGEMYLENNDEPDLKYSTLNVVKLYFIVSKKHAKAEEILAKLEEAFYKKETKNK